MGLFTDNNNSSYDGYPEGYFGEPNESFFRGLFSDEPVYSQPLIFGNDASMRGGHSPDYPKYRNYEDYFAKEHPRPTKDQFTVTNEDGSTEFDSNGYDEAMMEWYKKMPMY